MKVFEIKNGIIEYDEATPCVIAKFTGFMPSEDFRVFLLQGLDFLVNEMNKTGKEILWLADTRSHSVQSAEDTKWVSQEWNPKAFKNGLRHVAFVLPEKIFGQMAINNYAKENDQSKENQMKIKMFNSPLKAKNWFKEIKKLDSVNI
ncbi:MAG: hypothetical protein CMO01_27555 [Thalassobius sp.]|nr:hypothetical protein [Thalassovita sp.]